MKRAFYHFWMFMAVVGMVLNLIVMVVSIVQSNPEGFLVAWVFFLVSFVAFLFTRGELRDCPPVSPGKK